ncbi:MAG TPA: hypothetical protein PLE25_12825, partial [Spirochaetales bacterium]|nr:hypothetical protein [Spirochaetales bacterium]
MPSYVSVAFDLPVDRQWSYAEPEGLSAPVGARVEATLGRRAAVGWVVARSDTVDCVPAIVKPYLRLVDAEPLFGPETLRLAEWLSGMYYCSLGEALSAMTPSAERESRRKAKKPASGKGYVGDAGSVGDESSVGDA